MDISEECVDSSSNYKITKSRRGEVHICCGFQHICKVCPLVNRIRDPSAPDVTNREHFDQQTLTNSKVPRPERRLISNHSSETPIKPLVPGLSACLAFRGSSHPDPVYVRSVLHICKVGSIWLPPVLLHPSFLSSSSAPASLWRNGCTSGG